MATADAGLFHPNVKFRCRVAAAGSPDKWERMPMCLCAVSQAVRCVVCCSMFLKQCVVLCVVLCAVSPAVRCLGIQQQLLYSALGVELSSVAANSHLRHR